MSAELEVSVALSNRPRQCRDARLSVEATIRARLGGGDRRGAAREVLRLYGAELCGFVHAIAHDDDLAAAAFAQLGADIWRGLPAQRGDGSVRGWCYALARQALADARGGALRPAELSADDAAELDLQLGAAAASHRRGDAPDPRRELLGPDDHELMLLRRDRRLSWKDIARIRGGDGDLVTRAAALRKRYERANDRLRALGTERE